MEIVTGWRKRLAWAAALLGVVLLLQTSLPLRTELAAIRAYQVVASPLVGLMVTCRFEPTCSRYAVQVLEREGFARGNWLVAKRLIYCSPVGLLLPNET